jgi:hypothetical protein
MNQDKDFQILIADQSHEGFADIICDEMASSAKARGTGIAKRSPEYIREKMRQGKAVIAFTKEGVWAGFCYIETWTGDYVANSGLIVAPEFRKGGLAKKIKKKIFELSRKTLIPNSAMNQSPIPNSPRTMRSGADARAASTTTY